MRRRLGEVAVIVAMAGWLSATVIVAQEQSDSLSGTPAATLRKARSAADKMSTAGGNAATTEPVDLNRANEAALQVLPGLDAMKAKAIVAYRKHHGPFQSVEDLSKVPGLGEKFLAQLKAQVTVGE